MPRMKCSVCQEELLMDQQWFDRKKQHENWHRKGRNEGLNNVKGTVRWITVWEDE